MVNIMGLNKAEIMQELGKEAGCEFQKLEVYKPIVAKPGYWGAAIKGDIVVLYLSADDGFCEFWYDRTMGHGAAQRVVDRLRMKHRENKRSAI